MTKDLDQFNNEIWGVVPARGGSKSIPYKNLVRLGGRPLIDYVLTAGRTSKNISRLIVSTEDQKISEYCSSLQVEVHTRPEHLAQDDTPIDQVLQNLLTNYYEKEKVIPMAIALLQPTSPFLQAKHIDLCVEELTQNDKINSAQTITESPHNMHAINQRKLRGDTVEFCYPDQRKQYYNKQSKPPHFIFGNLVVTRSSAIIDNKGVFANPSFAVKIEQIYAYDLDKEADIQWGNYCLDKRLL